MTEPLPADRPDAETTSSPAQPVVDKAPPLAPGAPEQSPWWSAPSGRPVNIPDFAHELRAFLEWLFGIRQPVPVRVKARRR